MALAPRAVYSTQVAWDQYQRGLFTVGTSTLDGPDVLAASAWGATFAGVYDAITNPGDGTHVDSISIERGRDNDFAGTRAGTCTLSGRDPVGRYNRKNTGSVLAGKLQPLRPVRVTASFLGITYGLFYGFIDTITYTGRGRGGEFEITAVDFFTFIESAQPVIAPTGPTTTGAAIGLILDYLQWRDPAMRSLAVGDAIPGFSADGTKTASELIDDLLAAERGFFFIDGNGVVTYLSRNQPWTIMPMATVENTMDAIETGVDRTAIKNRWTVTRTGGTPQTWEDVPSENQFGLHDDSVGPTPYYNTDSEALAIAQFLVAQTHLPVTPLWSLPLRNKTDDLLTRILMCDLGHVWTVNEAKTPSTGTYFIEQVSHEIDLGGLNHVATFRLRERGPFAPFVLDMSMLDSGDVVTA